MIITYCDRRYKLFFMPLLTHSWFYLRVCEICITLRFWTESVSEWIPLSEPAWRTAGRPSLPMGVVEASHIIHKLFRVWFCLTRVLPMWLFLASFVGSHLQRLASVSRFSVKRLQPWLHALCTKQTLFDLLCNGHWPFAAAQSLSFLSSHTVSFFATRNSPLPYTQDCGLRAAMRFNKKGSTPWFVSGCNNISKASINHN
jgi:hypothetical protein